MSISVRRYLAIDQCLVPALFNTLLTGVLGWWGSREIQEISFWGAKSIAFEFLLTASLLPFVVCLIVSPLVAHHFRKGKIDRSDLSLTPSAWLPSRSVWIRAIVAALLATALSIPVLLLWSWLGPNTISVEKFIAVKMVFVAFVSGAMTALIAWWALLDTSRKLS